MEQIIDEMHSRNGGLLAFDFSSLLFPTLGATNKLGLQNKHNVCLFVTSLILQN